MFHAFHLLVANTVSANCLNAAKNHLVLAEVFFPFSFTRPAIFNTFSYISLILTTISLKIATTLKSKKN